ncbi:MAG: putative collagen-binding domain-containing protein, partial [Bacteroidota bacterium]
KLIRHRVVWGNFMAGGAGTEFYYGYGTGCTDLTCDNHRTRDQKYTDAAFALRFFQVHFQPYFPAVVNANDLTEDNDDYVLANPDNAYAVYRPDGGTTTITLPSGEWTVAWYNPRTGALSDASTLTGNQLVAPDANDWTALILPADCATGASCNDGNPCTTTDVWDEACNCVGTPLPDGDNDGVCDAEDACPDLDDALLGTSCDDGDPCTVDDVYRANCSCLGVAPTGQEIELLPIEDAYLEGSNTRVNNAELRIELENRVTYLKFNVPTFSGTPATASLELNVGSDPGNGTIIAALGDDNGWTETTLSSANAPGEARELGTLNGTFAVGQTYTWTLDPTAITSGPLTIIIRQTSGNDIAVKSAENDDAINHPRLRLSLKEETLPEGCVTLPLQWSTFDARPDGKNVALDWRTSAEENIGGFLVHHATDGRNWATIGEVSSDLAAIDGEYGFHHLAPGPGTHYDRIVAREPEARIAIETAATTNKVV